jgi:hypothetical protein
VLPAEHLASARHPVVPGEAPDAADGDGAFVPNMPPEAEFSHHVHGDGGQNGDNAMPELVMADSEDYLNDNSELESPDADAIFGEVLAGMNLSNNPLAPPGGMFHPLAPPGGMIHTPLGGAGGESDEEAWEEVEGMPSLQHVPERLRHLISRKPLVEVSHCSA